MIKNKGVMKKFKKILSLIFILPVMLFMCACGANDGDVDDGASQTQPPATVAPEQEQQEVIPSLSNSDAFLLAFNLIEDFKDGYEADDELKNTYLATVENYVTILKTSSEIEGLTSGSCAAGNDVEVDDIDTDLNHVEKILYTDKSTLEKVDVKLQLMFGYDAKNINLSYKFMFFEMSVDKRTNSFTFNAYTENSIEKSSIDSTGSFEFCKITGVLGDEGIVDSIDVYYFDRNTKIEEVSINTINNNYIKNFEGVQYKKGQENVYYLSSQSDVSMANTSSHQSLTAREVALVSVSQYRQFKYNGAIGRLQNVSELLVPLIADWWLIWLYSWQKLFAGVI